MPEAMVVGRFVYRSHHREEVIRTIGVSLIMVAAIAAASLTVVRQRSERESDLAVEPEGMPTAANLNLEAIRTAGL